MLHKLPHILIGMCILTGAGVALSKAIRGNMALGNHYAKLVAGCLNGHGFKAPEVVVICSPVRVGP